MGFAGGAEGAGSVEESVFAVGFVVNFSLFIRKTLPLSLIHFRSSAIAEVESDARGRVRIGQNRDPLFQRVNKSKPNYTT